MASPVGLVAREAREVRGAVRSAPRRVLVTELALALAVLLLGLVPMPAPELSTGQLVGAAALACWTALLVPARRRWPSATLLATAPVFAFHNVWVQAALPAITFAVARRIAPARRLWTVVSATAAADLLLVLIVMRSEPYGIGLAIAGHAAGLALLLLLPALSGALFGRRRPLVRVLRERNEYLEQSRLLTAEKARMAERAHLAAEMHDMLGHRLSLISMHAGALELTAAQEAPRVSGQAELLRTTAGTALSELRDVLGVLRDTTGDPPGAVGERSGSREDITELVSESRRAGVDVELTWSGADLDDVDLRIRHGVHRVVREGLTNAHKHSPNSRTEVAVGYEAGRVEVRVTSAPAPGARPRAPGTRQGLVGLEERIALLRGAFTAGATAEGGFRIAAELPAHPGLPATTGARHPPAVREVPEPLDAEVLTLPRALGAGCLGLLAAVPVVTATILLIFMLVFRMTL
ncbi:sensor histidine kinase [Saccharopolyspora cebuensis]|uniref:histidine kinase n=1 Tax=Saccharopolyspora cebuensis TaxID=418759 RepID=A0ABV4CMD6_9PSEU